MNLPNPTDLAIMAALGEHGPAVMNFSLLPDGQYRTAILKSGTWLMGVGPTPKAAVEAALASKPQEIY